MSEIVVKHSCGHEVGYLMEPEDLPEDATPEHPCVMCGDGPNLLPGGVCWVPQEHGRGCGAAVLAMITREPYAQVCAAFPGVDFETAGIGAREVDHYLAERGIAVARLFAFRSGSVPREPWPPAPFAGLHLCHVIVNEGSPCAHWTVMKQDGSVLDPITPEPRRLSDYEKVNNVAAVLPIDALKTAHHALTVLHGLFAYDGAAPGEAWQIDESETLRRLERVLPPPPWDLPGGEVTYLGREP